MKLTPRHWIAAGFSALVLAGWGVFWVLQVVDVIELLRMAYG